jgi:hypothetical protein
MALTSEDFGMSEAIRLLKKPVSSATQNKTAGIRSQGALQAKLANGLKTTATNATGRAPIAAPAFSAQAAPKTLQAKMHGPPQTGHSRPAMTSASGVVQANVIGGTNALQTRLNQWNTRSTRSTNPTAQQGRGANSAASGPRNGAPSIQRKTGPGVEAFRVPLRPKSGGVPLPDGVRAKMESAFSADFSDVRVHIGREASSLGAIAYTWGTNIHFAPGQYNPHTLQGQKLLGHELWHVVQQKHGRVKNPFGGGVAVVQDHALEAEADRMGIKAALTQVVRKTTE